MKRSIGVTLVLLTLLVVAFINPSTVSAQEDYPLESGDNSPSVLLIVVTVVYGIIFVIFLIARKASDWTGVKGVVEGLPGLSGPLKKLLTWRNEILIKGYLAALGVGVLLGAITGNWWIFTWVLAAPLCIAAILLIFLGRGI